MSQTTSGDRQKRQLASHGITVLLTARNEKRGLDAFEKLKGSSSDGFSDQDLIFHQLDVADSSSVATLAEFIKSQFGRLDILVNNAGIGGSILNGDALRAAAKGEAPFDLDIIMTQTYELGVECLQINYYGARRTVEALLPLLQLSQSPRIVNVSSSSSKLENIKNGWAKGILSDVDKLTEERVDEVLNEFLQDLKEGSPKAKGWPVAYPVSKAAMNAYTRILAKKFPNFKVNCVCPGFVKTDINDNIGWMSVEEGAEGPVKLALLPDDGPSGLFFTCKGVTSFD
ncbi:hypothetical protein ACH5RR_024037 [Cinchona calisaya]|uniref:(+)-neomenthol dehydrogenase n=1 Tax=Cinchona calisaya TaxID=153742 RepID=A0ABD2ZFP6_9GENT